MLIDGPEDACATTGMAGVAMYRLASSIGSIMSTRKGLWLFILWIHTCWVAEMSCNCCDEVVDVTKTVVRNVGIALRCGDQATWAVSHRYQLVASDVVKVVGPDSIVWHTRRFTGR